MSAEDEARAAARRVYETFHRREPNRNLRLHVPDFPASMPLLGQLEELVYSEPEGMPSARSGVRYRHESGDTGDGNTGARPLILGAPGGVLLIVPKPGEKPMRFTERGFVG